jgi:ubiquinone/menaquinone biosynthesis C-methylase UbiE
MKDRSIQDYYRARAAEYEQVYYRDIPNRRRELDAEAVRLKKTVAGKAVLDLACGTGYWTEVAAETARQVTAIDVSEEMLEEARKKQYVAPVSFILGDMFEHPLLTLSCKGNVSSSEGGEFDVVVIGFWFSHQPRQEYGELFDLIRRSLVPGGRVWMIDNNPPAEGPNQDSAYTDRYGNNFKRRFLENGDEYIILKNYFGKDDLRQVFSGQFEIEDLVYGTYYWSITLSPAR